VPFGWQTDEVLLRCLVESSCVALTGAALSLVLAFAWLRWLNGFWIASVFLTGIAAAPPFAVPFRLAPVPTLLAFVIAFVVVACGSLYSTWQAAVAAPFQALR
jgi:ABC-type lipoprotein release transport system permease subunit